MKEELKKQRDCDHSRLSFHEDQELGVNSSRNEAVNGSKNEAVSCHTSNYQSVALNEEECEDTLSPPNVTVGAQMIGRILLFIVSFLYGTMNVTFRLLYALDNPPSASALSTVRGWLAAICFVPFIIQQKRFAGSRTQQSPTAEPNTEELRRPLWIVSLELASLNFGAQALINSSLIYIPSARASFLTETSVVITPLLSAALGHSVKWTVWLACAAAMTGLVILSNNNNEGIGSFSFGDLLVLMGACCWSFYIFRLSQCGAYDEVQMQALKTVFLACLYTCWFLGSSVLSTVPLWAGYGSIVAWLLLFYSALGPGAVADIIQQKGQASIAAAEANVILAMEPVFTSILGFLVLAEALTLQECFGGGFLICAAVLATR